MSEMVERVARALVQLLLPYQSNYAVGDLDGTTFSYIDIGEQDMAEFAEAAIEAMREPTPEMLAAFYECTNHDGAPYTPDGKDGDEGLTFAFGKMIDTAPKATKPPSPL